MIIKSQYILLNIVIKKLKLCNKLLKIPTKTKKNKILNIKLPNTKKPSKPVVTTPSSQQTNP
jgi:hypothetical protein